MDLNEKVIIWLDMERNLHVVELKSVTNMIEIIAKLLFMQIPKSQCQRLSNPNPEGATLPVLQDTVGGDIDDYADSFRSNPKGS